MSGSLTAVTKKLEKCCGVHEVRRKYTATELLVVLHFCRDEDIKRRLVTATFVTNGHNNRREGCRVCYGEKNM